MASRKKPAPNVEMFDEERDAQARASDTFVPEIVDEEEEADPDRPALPPDAIDIRDTGPIEYVVLPILPEGGVVELLADNGMGKTTAIQAVASLATGSKLKAKVRDGAFDGEVRGPHARIYLNQKRSKHEGELGIASLDSDVDPSVLVNPPFQDAEVRDLHRMKMLCRIAEVPNEFKLFTKTLGRFRQLVSEKAMAQESVPEMKAAIERDLQKRARDIEHLVDEVKGRAQALGAFVEGFTADLPEVDVDGVYRELADAQAAQRALVAEREQGAVRDRLAGEARKAIDELAADVGPSAADLALELGRVREIEAAASDDMTTTRGAFEAVAPTLLIAVQRRDAKARDVAAQNKLLVVARNTVAELEEQLAEARDRVARGEDLLAQRTREHEEATAEHARIAADLDARREAAREAFQAHATRKREREQAAELLQAAQYRERASESALQAIAAAESNPTPSYQEVANAEELVEEKKRAHENAIEARAARDKALQAKAALEEMATLEAEATSLRETCEALDAVIEAAIARVRPRGLSVRDGRVFARSGPRGVVELYDGLSDGLRWEIGFDACVDAVGDGGLLTMARSAWIEMSPTRRRQVWEHARRRRVTVYVERASVGRLRAVVYQPDLDPELVAAAAESHGVERLELPENAEGGA